MIVEMTRGHIRAQYDGRSITVEGEVLLGHPNFVIYADSINAWDPPYAEEEFTAEDKESVLRRLKKDLDERGLTYEIE